MSSSWSPAALAAALDGARCLVLTGAGMSTASGIPDYRGPGSRPRAPIQHADFVRSPEVRRRYWARSLVGWPRIARARPCAAHHALVRLERAGVVHRLITQNVDGLHQQAGSTDVIDLHGRLADVRCLGCGAVTSRAALQTRLAAENPELARASAQAAPDGDAELAPDAIERFRVVDCEACGGALKPDVVFFGGSVPPERVQTCYAALEEASALLVLGSSLTVFSGYRFVLRAVQRGLPVHVINRGPTRGDEYAAIKLDLDLGFALDDLASALSSSCNPVARAT